MGQREKEEEKEWRERDIVSKPLALKKAIGFEKRETESRLSGHCGQVVHKHYIIWASFQEGDSQQKCCGMVMVVVVELVDGPLLVELPEVVDILHPLQKVSNIPVCVHTSTTVVLRTARMEG